MTTYDPHGNVLTPPGAYHNDADCPLCQHRGKTWEGGDPECAFQQPMFSPENNWRCATIGVLRDLITWYGNTTVSSVETWVGVLPFESVIDGMDRFIVLVGYKNRGAIERAWVADLDSMLPLTLPVAHDAIAYWQQREGKTLRFRQLFHNVLPDVSEP